eukprot:1917753-Pyramimonas_sp.AAC.1
MGTTCHFPFVCQLLRVKLGAVDHPDPSRTQVRSVLDVHGGRGMFKFELGDEAAAAPAASATGNVR